MSWSHRRRPCAVRCAPRSPMPEYAVTVTLVVPDATAADDAIGKVDEVVAAGVQWTGIRVFYRDDMSVTPEPGAAEADHE